MWSKPVVLLGFAATTLLIAATWDHEAGKRQLVNAWEVYHEVHCPDQTQAAIPKHLPSFLEYQETMLYHPKFGYYSSGRVNFTDDFRTFPNALAPYFGRMVAQQVFRMWDGMRQAGTLSREEKFTIAEFGAGNGLLAESILDYLRQQAQGPADPRWREFGAQAIYVTYDRAPALREAQRRRNNRFGPQFEARDGDATNLAQTVPPDSLKGVILSNEMLDVFGVHKVILQPDGDAETAFVIPWLSPKTWTQIQSRLRPAIDQIVLDGDRSIKRAFWPDEPPPGIFLSREALPSLLEALSASPDYASLAHSIHFHEVYLPARDIPDLKAHLKKYAHAYASELARSGKGVVTYVSPGEEKFIRGAARALRAGYVITIDYGSNWDGIMTTAQPHLRTYGPGNQQSAPTDLLTGLTMEHASAGQSGSRLEATPQWNELGDIEVLAHTTSRGNPDPYRWPGLNDITTDVNFSYLAAEGQLAGLRPVYYGPQKALLSGTSISFSAKNSGWLLPRGAGEVGEWLKQFATNAAFKVLVEQKLQTDDAYSYPDTHPETMDVNENGLTATQRKRAAEIEQAILNRN